MVTTASVPVASLVLPRSARVAGLGGTGFAPLRPANVSHRVRSTFLTRRTGESLVARAESGSGEMDLDAIIAKYSDKFDKAENKPAVIGLGVGGLVAFFFVEWLIHLPVLNILLGFPAQVLGLLLGPYLLIRYLVDKEDIMNDVEAVVAKVTALLPGQQ